MKNLFKRTSKNILIAVIIGSALLTSVTAGVFLLTLNFDGIEFNGDSFVYFINAKHFSTSVAAHTLPRPAYWPYGYPALLSLSFVLGDVSYESARWVNVIVGGLLIATLCSILFFISKLKNWPFDQTLLVILCVGLLPLGHGFFIKYQLTMMSDMTAVFLNALTMLLCWQWRDSNKLIYILLAGLVFGLSLFTRYVNALMLLPVLVVLSSVIDFRQTRFITRSIGVALLFGIAALVVFVPQLYITLQDTSSTLGNSLLNGWDLKNFFTMVHESIDGSQPAKVPSIFYYFLLPFKLQCFTPLGIILLGLGIKYSLRELPRWFSGSMIVWYLVFYILLCGIPLQNGRIGFSLFLPVVIWMSLGLLECKLLWEKKFAKIVVLVSLVWCVSFVFSFKSVRDFVESKNELKLTAEIIAKEVPKASRIISTSPNAVYNAYPMTVESLSMYEISIKEAEKLFASRTPVFLAVDEKHFIPQWKKYPAGKCYDWIKSNYSCTFKFNVGEYTVYEVKNIK
ncbi:MAG TPA: hypothetical protein VNW06_04465 [Cytophagaceae bacterium]|nr:hypothetical protein [Cytophagaceae bacterium]